VKDEVSIVGAGLAGSLLSIFLARRGLAVTVYDRLPDLRKHTIPAGRSINLALAERGLLALAQVELRDAVKPLLIPMRGRMLHDAGMLSFQPYGRRETEVIYSVSRAELTRLLIDAAESRYGVVFRFEHGCAGVDFGANALRIREETAGVEHAVPLGGTFAADGSGSVVRRSLVQTPNFVCSEELLGHRYKELVIPPAEGGGHRLDPHALHIWPRGEFMLIALPNTDGSFTATLFLPGIEFDRLDEPRKLQAFVSRHFPDTLETIPAWSRDFFENPTGSLVTVRCRPWHRGDQICLIGDASHAIVPFHGQGMNCAFEDCLWIDRLLDRHRDWDALFGAFERLRKPNTDAIAAMALENYVEMRDTVRDPRFQLKKALAWELEGRYPDHFIPRYSMVMFHPELPYAEAQRRGTLQAEILEALTEEVADLEDVDFARAALLVESRLEPIRRGLEPTLRPD